MRINGKGLGMVRSDTELLTWYMVDTNDTIIPLVSGDKAYFKLWADMDTESALLTKEITTFTVDGKVEFDFAPADTKDIEPGDYFYSIYVVYADTDEQTPIARYPFKLRRR